MSEFRKRRAAALIFVLGLITLTAIVATGIVELASQRLKPLASSSLEAQLKLDAHSALSAAVAVLREYAEIDGGLYAPSQGWNNPLADSRIEFEESQVEVKITDESGKIPIANLTPEKLVKIFEEWGITSSGAQQAADCIIDWSDADDARRIFGAEYDDYDKGTPRPPNRALKSFSELAYIKYANEIFFDREGNPTDYYRIFAENISLENFAKTNLNSASEETLALLCIFDSEDYEEDLYKAIRGEIGSISDGKYWVENAAEIENRGARYVPRSNANVKATLLKIEINVKRGIAEYKLVAYYGSETTSTQNTSQSKTNNSGGNANTGTGGNKTNAGVATTAKPATSAMTSTTSKGMKILKVIERGEQ